MFGKIILFLFILTGQLSAGLENSKECDESCQKKIKESTTKKKLEKSKTTSLDTKIREDIPTETNALKESIKRKMIYGQSYKGKLEQIKTLTSHEIENQGILEMKSIQESHFQPINSDGKEPKINQIDKSFLFNEINEKLKWRRK